MIAGLNELVPENLLAIFDENELEVRVAQMTKSPLAAQAAAAAAGILIFSVRLLLPQLLMCGTGDINVQDFKAHAVIVGGSWHFREKVSREEVRLQRWAVANVSERRRVSVSQVMKWFWAVVSSFTQEELARLLQFTTGSSQLPPGGFNTLCPSFQIIAAPTHSTLPTAHTW